MKQKTGPQVAVAIAFWIIAVAALLPSFIVLGLLIFDFLGDNLAILVGAVSGAGTILFIVRRINSRQLQNLTFRTLKTPAPALDSPSESTGPSPPTPSSAG